MCGWRCGIVCGGQMTSSFESGRGLWPMNAGVAYRRLPVLPRRERLNANHKRPFGLDREERLMVHRRGVRKGALGCAHRCSCRSYRTIVGRSTSLPTSSSTAVACVPRVVFVDCARMPGVVADTSISGIRVARELDRLLADGGKPKIIVSDNGIEPTMKAILQWADDH